MMWCTALKKSKQFLFSAQRLRIIDHLGLWWHQSLTKAEKQQPIHIENDIVSTLPEIGSTCSLRSIVPVLRGNHGITYPEELSTGLTALQHWNLLSLVSWFRPSQQQSTMQPLAHSCPPAGWGGENTTKGSWVETRTGRHHSPVMVTGKPDSTWGKRNQFNLLPIKSE